MGTDTLMDLPDAVIPCAWKNCAHSGTLLVPPETRHYTCPTHTSLVHMATAMVKNLADAHHLFRFNGHNLVDELHAADIDLDVADLHDDDVVALMQRIVNGVVHALTPGHAAAAVLVDVFDKRATRWRQTHATVG